MTTETGGAAVSAQIKLALDTTRKAFHRVDRGQVEALLEVAVVAIEHAHTYQIEDERELERAKRAGGAP